MLEARLAEREVELAGVRDKAEGDVTELETKTALVRAAAAAAAAKAAEEAAESVAAAEREVAKLRVEAQVEREEAEQTSRIYMYPLYMHPIYMCPIYMYPI